MRKSIIALFATFFTLILFSKELQAERFAYVYIQGDKSIPFYVKFEGEMLPRFGKNYYIISELAPGPITLEVLFQQNAYPAQKFMVQVPDGGFRGFLLMQKDGSFKLYDIHRQFYLPAGNTIEDDHIELSAIPAYANNVYTPVVPGPLSNNGPGNKGELQEEPIVAPVKAKQSPKVVKAKPSTTVKEPSKIIVEESGPSFIGDIELRNNKTQGGNNMLPAGGTTAVVRNKVAVINSDCPTAMSNNQFDVLLKRVNNKTSTERLKVIFDKLDNCFTSNQIRILVKTLSGDDQRFTLLKKAYPRVTDQSAFENLETLLSGQEWKGYFREMIHKN